MQFLLFNLTFKCKNVVSFRGLHLLTPRPGALPPDLTGGIAPRPPLQACATALAMGWSPNFKNVVAPLARPIACYFYISIN